MGRKKIPDFMKHNKLSDYSIEKGLIDYVDARAKDFQTTGSEMFSRIVRFYMEYNDTGTILEEKRKKAEIASKEYEIAKAKHDEREGQAHRHAHSLARKFYTDTFKDMNKRDYVFIEMASKTGLSPDECLEILNDAGKRNAEAAIDYAKECANDETTVGRA